MSRHMRWVGTLWLVMTACGVDEGSAPHAEGLDPHETVAVTTTAPKPTMPPFDPGDEPLIIPAGALPVIELDFYKGENFQQLGLPPGHYRIRILPYQADWPEECLSDAQIGEPPEDLDLDRISLPPPPDYDPASVEAYERAGMERWEQRLAILNELCGPYREALPDLSHLIPPLEEAPVRPGDPGFTAPTTTIG